MPRHAILLALALLAPALPTRDARGQDAAEAPTGISAVDSARAARAAWRRGAAAMQAGDLAAARREADRAATAWPVQPAYPWGRAVVAARQGDTTGVRDALAAYAALGLGRSLKGHPVLGAYASHAALASVVARLDANARPVARGVVVATLPDSTFWPEGMDGDARSGRRWVASVRHRTVVELAPGKAPRELWPRDRREMGAVMGVRADARRGVLWVTTSHVANARDDGATGEAALLRVRMADGTVERRWTLPASARGRVLGDLAIGPRGDVWVTDSQDPALYRLRPGADTLERLTSPLFSSPQGMAPSPDGRVVYVADYSHGLLRVDVATGAVTKLDDAPGSTSIGCDGIAWYRGAIVAVQNGVAPARVMRFTLDATGRRIVRAQVLDQQPEVADEPTIGAVIGDRFVYVANSAWEKYRDDGARAPGTRLATPVLLAVPLR